MSGIRGGGEEWEIVGKSGNSGKTLTWYYLVLESEQPGQTGLATLAWSNLCISLNPSSPTCRVAGVLGYTRRRESYGVQSLLHFRTTSRYSALSSGGGRDSPEIALRDYKVGGLVLGTQAIGNHY